jgi:5'-3' exonuclease
MTLLVDGDILVYSVGFISETRWYEIVCPSTGETKVFQTKKDIKLFNKDIAGDDIKLCRTPHPEQFARTVMGSMIKGWKEKFSDNDVKVFLTDKDLKNNFRYKLTDQYKANRKGSVKPLHYQMLRDYLIDSYDTEVVVGIEADDALGIHASDDTIIISKDKDLLQVPGRHYNITKNKQIKATNKGKLELWRDKAKKARLTGHGFKWFCAQMLLGDDVDNIKGINRMGAVRTHKILDKVKTNEECWEVIKSIYEEKGRSDDLLLNAQLLWILREEGGWFDEEKI